MESDSFPWMPLSFDRPPEWRWLRAQYLVDRNLCPDPRRDDEWVRLAHEAITGGDDGPKVDAIRAARWIWAAGPCRQRDELDARLLTEEPFDRLEGRLGIPAAAIEAYCQVFFPVRPLRWPNDWVLLQAVGYSALSGFAGSQPGGIWKYTAYAFGAQALDLMIAVTTGEPLPANVIATLPQGCDEDLFRRKVLLSARLMMARTDEEVASVVEDRQRLRAIEAEQTGEPGGHDQSIVEMESFLIALPGLQKAGRQRNARAGKATAKRPASQRPCVAPTAGTDVARLTTAPTQNRKDGTVIVGMADPVDAKRDRRDRKVPPAVK